MARGYTQPQVARALDVALRSYQSYEQGSRKPSYEMLVKIALFLHVSTDWLLGLTDGAPFDE